MIKKINYYSEEEKNIILEENKDMYLIEHAKLYNEKYLIFSDSPPIEVLQKEQGEKIFSRFNIRNSYDGGKII